MRRRRFHAVTQRGRVCVVLALLWFSGAHTFAQGRGLDPTERPAGAPLAAPVGSPERPGGLNLAPKLTAALWAGTPQLANPTALSFDEQGRLWVAETHRFGTSALDIRDHPELLERDFANRTTEDYVNLLHNAFGGQAAPLPVESETVRLIADTDGDGTADTSRIVAEGFNTVGNGVAGGILAQRNQIWFTSSPSLWKLAPPSLPSGDQRQEVVRGFGVHLGDPRHGLNGIVPGPDGRLYFSVGDRGAHVIRADGTTLSNPESGAVFRCYPDGSGLEIVATGLRNPHDLAFDEFGNLFTGDGASAGGDRARLVYVVDGGDGGWRMSHPDTPLSAASPWRSELRGNAGIDSPLAYYLPPVGDIEEGPRGLAYYPGSGLTADYRGTFFLCHFADRSARSGIMAYTLERRGAGFALASGRPFVRGALPTDVTFGSDSRLYFTDWVSRWPWPRPERGRIYVVDASDVAPSEREAWAETRRLVQGGTTGRAEEELAGLLGHADQRVRLAAQFELVERGPVSLPVFKRIAENTTAPQLARIHALWGAGQLAERVPSALNHVMALLRDEDAEVRAQSAKLLGEYFRFESFRFLTTALNDSESRVAFFAAQSLGKLKRPEAIPFLLELLRRNNDQDAVLRHGVVIALSRLGADSALHKTIADPSRAVRRGGLLAYRRLMDPAVASFLADFDPSIVREAALAINDEPIDGAMAALAGILEQAPLDDEPVIYRAINAHFRLGEPANAQALATFAGRSYVPAKFRAEALNRLAEWGHPPTRDRITGLHRPLASRELQPARQALQEFLSAMSGKAPEDVQVAAIRAVAALGMPGTGHALWDVVFQTAHPLPAQIAALQALERLDDLRLEVAVQHAARSDQTELRMAAIPILGRLHPAVSLPLFQRMANRGTAAELRAIFTLLSKISDPRADEILDRALDRLRAGDLPVAAHVELLNAATSEARPELSRKVTEIEAEWQTGTDQLASYRSALEGGDVLRGRQLYERQLDCVRCHEEGSDPVEAGPSLWDVGRARSASEWVEAIVNHPRPAGSKAVSNDWSPVPPRADLRDLVAYLLDLQKNAVANSDQVAADQLATSPVRSE